MTAWLSRGKKIFQEIFELCFKVNTKYCTIIYVQILNITFIKIINGND